MMDKLSSESQTDLPYYVSEINRGIGMANGDFMQLDGAGPIQTSIDRARAQQHVRILDAGCGTGYGLITLKEQVTFRAPLVEESIEAVGVSLEDYSSQLEGWKDRKRVREGYVALHIGNLATIALEREHFDVAYSSQVLMHNQRIAPVIKNVMSTLKRGGVYYFDTSVEQRSEMDSFAHDLGSRTWHLQSRLLTRQFITGKNSQYIHRLERL